MKAAKSVVEIWQWGGPSQLETFDPKPEASRDFNGGLKAIPTNVPGMSIHEWWPELAKCADLYSVIRTMTHTQFGHESAAYLMQTGRLPGGGEVFPAIGAVVFEGLTPDSMGYCLFVSVVYLLLSVFAVRVNLRNLPEERGSRGILAGILSGALYGLSAVSLFGFLAEGIWKPYFVGLGRSADRIEWIINAACVVGAVLILLAVVLFRRKTGNLQDMSYS